MGSRRYLPSLSGRKDLSAFRESGGRHTGIRENPNPENGTANPKQDCYTTQTGESTWKFWWAPTVKDSGKRRSGKSESVYQRALGFRLLTEHIVPLYCYEGGIIICVSTHHHEIFSSYLILHFRFFSYFYPLLERSAFLTLENRKRKKQYIKSVSYTHLTLPTNSLV